MSKLTEENLLVNIKISKHVSAIIKSINKHENFKNILVDRTSYLPIDSSNIERCYHIRNDIYKLVYCPICKTVLLKWNPNGFYNNTCLNTSCKSKYRSENLNMETEMLRRSKLSLKFATKSQEDINIINAKIKATNIEHFGVDSYAKTTQFKKHMLDNYGYVSPFELKETHDKAKETLLRKYGVDHNFKIEGMQERIKQTFIKNYGETSPLKNVEIRNKLIQTNNERYGHNSPSLNMFNSKKSSYKKYEFNDEEINLQGYEDYVLFEILNKYDITDILIKNIDIKTQIGEITYEYNGNIHTYYPDFYIKSKNLIVEVKSYYTYNLDLDRNLCKKQACLNKKLNFEFIIVSRSIYDTWTRKNKK